MLSPLKTHFRSPCLTIGKITHSRSRQISHTAWVALAADRVRPRQHRVVLRLVQNHDASQGVTMHSWIWKRPRKTTVPNTRLGWRLFVEHPEQQGLRVKHTSSYVNLTTEQLTNWIIQCDLVNGLVSMSLSPTTPTQASSNV